MGTMFNVIEEPSLKDRESMNNSGLLKQTLKRAMMNLRKYREGLI